MKITAKEARAIVLGKQVDEITNVCRVIMILSEAGASSAMFEKLQPATLSWLMMNGFEVRVTVTPGKKPRHIRRMHSKYLNQLADELDWMTGKDQQTQKSPIIVCWDGYFSGGIESL